MRKEKFNQKKKKTKQNLWPKHMTALEPPRNFTKKGDENRSCKSWKPVSWIPWTAGRIMRTRRSMEVLQICRKRAMVLVVEARRRRILHTCANLCLRLSLSLLSSVFFVSPQKEKGLSSCVRFYQILCFFFGLLPIRRYSYNTRHNPTATIYTRVPVSFFFSFFFFFWGWYNNLNLKLVIKEIVSSEIYYFPGMKEFTAGSIGLVRIRSIKPAPHPPPYPPGLNVAVYLTGDRR
jgi:hypothetical protein